MTTTHGLVVARLIHQVEPFNPRKRVILSRCDIAEFTAYSVSSAKLAWYLKHTKYGETMSFHCVVQHLTNTL